MMIRIGVLTPREIEVLELYPECGTLKEIASVLGIKEQTIKNHAGSIKDKLDTASLGQAALLYERALRDSWPKIERRVGERRGA